MQGNPKSLTLRARLVLPLHGPPIPNGAVEIRDGLIGAVRRWSRPLRGSRNTVVDLGESVLLPGLVNAHCHLDYTGMAGHFPPPRLFTDWLKAITETKAGWDLDDYRTSWLSGAQMLLTNGSTTVADIEAVPELLATCWRATPLRVFSFLELIGITERRPPGSVLGDALRAVPRHRPRRCAAGLSPHAPYSTVPELIRLASEEARKRSWPLSIHVAESRPEFDMFRSGRGEMFRWIKRSGRNMTDCDGRTPIGHLERCGALGPDLQAVHVNYLGRGDVERLAASGTHVVHCPRSHYYFRHDKFPLRRLLKAGVNVCLGTDSLASVCRVKGQSLQLSMFEEMRALAESHSWLRPAQILAMATLNGARSLGRQKQFGELRPGAQADLIALPAATATPRGACEAVLAHQGPVQACMIDGRWALAPGWNTTPHA